VKWQDKHIDLCSQHCACLGEFVCVCSPNIRLAETVKSFLSICPIINTNLPSLIRLLLGLGSSTLFISWHQGASYAHKTHYFKVLFKSRSSPDTMTDWLNYVIILEWISFILMLENYLSTANSFYSNGYTVLQIYSKLLLLILLFSCEYSLSGL